MSTILIVPVGTVNEDVLSVLDRGLEKIFQSNVETGRAIPVPPDSYDHRRKQYHSTAILEVLLDIKPDHIDRLLGVTEVDLYIPGLNFVFGEASLTAGVAVISLARLRQEFYGFESDRALLFERALKEAVHELGHTHGLGHCPNPRCIMYFSNSLGDTDRKGPGFCERCKALLGR